VISAGRFLTVLAGAAALGLMGVLLGAWWAPFLAGVGAGVFIVSGRRAVFAGAIAGLIAWGGPLAYAQVEFGLARTAASLAAMMGFTGAATIPVALTLLVGTLLGFAGAWFGTAARSFYPTASATRPPRPARPAAARPPAVKTPS